MVQRASQEYQDLHADSQNAQTRGIFRGPQDVSVEALFSAPEIVASSVSGAPTILVTTSDQREIELEAQNIELKGRIEALSHEAQVNREYHKAVKSAIRLLASI